jgi:hypothetical protein
MPDPDNLPDEGPWPPEELPAHDQLADDTDELDWDVDRDGPMSDAASDDEPPTEPWKG